MRQLISGLVAAVAVMIVGAMPAMACGGGLFQSSCSPCGQAYVSPCAQPQYVEPVYSGCNSCGGWAHERLPEPEQEYQPVHQYYYADQGPTYTGPGNFAPYRTYQEGGYGEGYGGYHRLWHHTGYGYGAHYGYHHSYAPHHYGYGFHHALRRYY